MTNREREEAIKERLIKKLAKLGITSENQKEFVFADEISECCPSYGSIFAGNDNWDFKHFVDAVAYSMATRSDKKRWDWLFDGNTDENYYAKEWDGMGAQWKYVYEFKIYRPGYGGDPIYSWIMQLYSDSPFVKKTIRDWKKQCKEDEEDEEY